MRAGNSSSLQAGPGGRTFCYKDNTDSAATAALLDLCRRTCAVGGGGPSAAAVAECIKAGAALATTVSGVSYSFLSDLVRCGAADAVAACLQTQQRIDFTAGGRLSCPLLALIRDPPLLSVSVMCEMLQSIVFRVETHPCDVIAWDVSDAKGRNILQVAADTCRLAAVWKIVRHISYFDDHSQPFALEFISSSDWEELRRESQQQYFSVDNIGQ